MSVGLKGCSAFVDRDGLHAIWDAKKNPVRDFKDTYSVTEIGNGYFEASGSFMVKVSETPASRPVVTIECEFEAHLHGEKPLNAAFVERFVGSAFQLIVIPYARLFVSSVSAQMSIPPLVLPLSIESPKDSKSIVKKSKAVRAKAHR